MSCDELFALLRHWPVTFVELWLRLFECYWKTIAQPVQDNCPSTDPCPFRCVYDDHTYP